MTLKTQVVLDLEISQFTIILWPVDDQGTFIICNHCIQIIRVENRFHKRHKYNNLYCTGTCDVYKA